MDRGHRFREDEESVRPLNEASATRLSRPLPHSPTVWGCFWLVARDGGTLSRGSDQGYRRQQLHPDRVMDFMVHNEVAPAVDQIETHPFHQQVETQKFLEQHNVQIESWGPFAEGRNNIFQHGVLRSIGGKYGKSVAQVILRWLTQRGVVAIPKSVRMERI